MHIQELILSKNTKISEDHLILNKNPKSAEDRLSVYRQAYTQRLSTSLMEDFILTARKMGDVQFNSVIQDYIEQNPSQYSNLAEYSQDFPRYLKQRYSEFYPIADLEWKLLQIELLQDFQFYLILATHSSIDQNNDSQNKLFFEYLIKARSFDEIESWLSYQNQPMDVFLSNLVQWISSGTILVLEKREL